MNADYRGRGVTHRMIEHLPRMNDRGRERADRNKHVLNDPVSTIQKDGVKLFVLLVSELRVISLEDRLAAA